ncbi:MAG: ABC transporter substrate-binding protein [Angelakisella sp.]
MNKWTKLVSMLLCTCMVFSLAACGGAPAPAPQAPASPAPEASKSEVAPAPAPAPAAGKTQVQFWHSMGGKNGEILLSVVEAYNKSQDKIEVVPTYQGGYYDSIAKAQTAISAGNSPDILQSGSGQVDILAKEEGVLEDLVPYMTKAGMKVEDFVPAFLTGMGFPEKPTELLAFPMGCSTPVMFVNNDLLKKAGLPVPASWDEMDATAQKLIKAGTVEYGFALPHDPWYFWMTVGQFGGSSFNAEGTALGCIEDKTGINAMTTLQNMCKNKTMFFGPATDSDSVCRQMFFDGKVAMYVASIANLGSISSGATFDYSVEFGPKGTVTSGPSGGTSLTLLSASQNKDAAWEFLQWLYTSEEGIATFAVKTGYLPCSYPISKTKIVQDTWASNPNAKKAFDQLQYGNNKHMIRGAGDCANSVAAMMEAVLYDSADVTKQMNTLNDEIKDILAEVKG